MRIPRIYLNQTLKVHQITPLDKETVRYLCSVLRLSDGAEVIIFNGRGGEYHGILKHSRGNQTSVDVCRFDAIERESPLHVHVGIGISRGARMELVMQKLTELGVTEITPLMTRRVEVKLPEPRMTKKNLHWQKIAISACQQCLRNRLPLLHPTCQLGEWLPTVNGDAKLVLDHREANSLGGLKAGTRQITLLVGPEGGLDDVEIKAAQTTGFVGLGLGPRVFRTETAPLVAVSVLQALFGDLQ